MTSPKSLPRKRTSGFCVIGGALDAWMMVPGWIRGQTTPEAAGVQLSHLVDHIDHVCQLAGDSFHAAIGSDLDGAFGKEQSPYDLETIADLQKISGLLAKRGYHAPDINNIMHGNWLRFLRKAWPARRQPTNRRRASIAPSSAISS